MYYYNHQTTSECVKTYAVVVSGHVHTPPLPTTSFVGQDCTHRMSRLRIPLRQPRAPPKQSPGPVPVFDERVLRETERERERERERARAIASERDRERTRC